jgi:hypothetical protein
MLWARQTAVAPSELSDVIGSSRAKTTLAQHPLQHPQAREIVNVSADLCLYSAEV